MNCRAFAVAFAALGAWAGPAQAQYPFEVPYVPTPQIVVDEMLRAAAVASDDLVMDLGSGDGRIPITAARKFGARAIGVDLDADLVVESEENARLAGVGDRVRFLQQDLFKSDLSQATVITLYLLPQVNRRLRSRLLELRPGTRIVAHDFDLGDWKPDAKTTIRKNVFLWIVPAQVAGRWQARVALPAGERNIEFEFSQNFQEIDGIARIEGQRVQMWEPRLRADRIRFVIVDAADRDNEAGLYFDARINGDVMEGEITRGVGAAQSRIRWRAVRSGA